MSLLITAASCSRWFAEKADCSLSTWRRDVVYSLCSWATGRSFPFRSSEAPTESGCHLNQSKVLLSTDYLEDGSLLALETKHKLQAYEDYNEETQANPSY